MTYSRDNRHFPHILQCNCRDRAAASRSNSSGAWNIGTTLVPSGAGGPMYSRRGPTKCFRHQVAPCSFLRAARTPSIIKVPAVNVEPTCAVVGICAHYLPQLGVEPVTKVSESNVRSRADVDTKTPAKPQFFDGHTYEHLRCGDQLVNPHCGHGIKFAQSISS